MNRLTNRLAKESNRTLTENLAEAHRSTLNDTLDFFYLAPARQGEDNTALFVNAYEESKNLALKCAFYIRDVRQGKGQRLTFRQTLSWLANNDRKVFDAVVPCVAEYGRWDDILMFLGFDSVNEVVKFQFWSDVESNTPSLLGKWMPSENTSSSSTKSLAQYWIKTLGLTPRQYRKHLSALREKIRVVERDMSANRWSEITYPHVPSRAMKLYRKAFLRHDEDRFSQFIQKATTGEEKIHSAGVYPHEIVKSFMKSADSDKALEAMWVQLPNYFGDEERNVLVIVDVSGSMVSQIPGTSTQCIHVSVGLGLYCAERNKGAFHNYLMTFSGEPQIELIRGSTLRAKINHISNMNWGMNTDIQAAFRALLRMAVQEGVPAEEMPSNILIISDMEFDRCVSGGTNLENIHRQYEQAGYELPLVTFWNVQARHNQVPATGQEKGVFLVSGFSAETIGKVLNAQAVTPEDLMLEILNSERYVFVDSIA